MAEKTTWQASPNYVVVKVSARLSVVAEKGIADWHYRACTKAIDGVNASKVCKELNELDPKQWSLLTQNNYLPKPS